jgi:hypothetical protein
MTQEMGSGRWELGDSALPTPISHPPTPGPVLYRAGFAYNTAIHGAGPFKLHLPGMVKGQIWLNGRNLGRYWQIGPQECYKLPAAWLCADNQLVIFEEEDGRPDEVRISTDALGASQIVAVTLALGGQERP